MESIPVVLIGSKKVHCFLHLNEILFIRMENNTLTFFTQHGKYRLATRFESINYCIKSANSNFLVTDRGVIINSQKAERFDKDRMIVKFDGHEEYFATVSNKHFNKISKLFTLK